MPVEVRRHITLQIRTYRWNLASAWRGVTPGRRIPASIAAAVQIAQPKFVPYDELLTAFEAKGYCRILMSARQVADQKCLVSTLFVAHTER